MKRFLAVTLLISLCVGLCACGSGSMQPTQDNTILATTPATTEPIETTLPTEPPIVYTPVKQGDTVITAEGSEFIIAETDWVYELSVNLDEYSSLWIGEAAKGNILMYTRVTYTNKSASGFNLNHYYNWGLGMLYDNTYNYYPKTINDTFSGMELQPLMTGDFYVVFEVPEQLKYDGKAIEVMFSVDGVYYSFLAREEESATEMNTSLNVDEKKVINGKGEITLVNTTTAKKLLPPNTSGQYSYYEAQEGYTYAVAEFVVKNLGQESIDTRDTIKGTVNVDGQTIEGMCVLVSGDKRDLATYYVFDVLAEHVAYFVAEVPDDKIATDISFSIMFCDEKFMIPLVTDSD